MTPTERKTVKTLRAGAETMLAAEQAIEQLKAERDVARRHIQEIHEYAQKCDSLARHYAEQNQDLRAKLAATGQAATQLAASVDAMRTKFLGEVQSMRNMAKFFGVDIHAALDS